MFPAALLRTPTFVMGCPRSGTTFVGELLGSHSCVVYWNEPPEIMAYCPRVFRREVAFEEARAFYHEVYGRWLGEQRLDGVARFAEKCPRHVLVLPFLARAFPEGRFIHVVRDGRAVVSSLIRTGWLANTPDAPGGHRARYYVPRDRRERFEVTTEAGRAALVWDIYVRAGMAGRTLAPDRYVEVRYEDVLRAPDEWGGRLLRFMGLSMEGGVARFVRRTRRDRDAAWRRELGAPDRAMVEETAGDLLEELSYGDQ